MTTYSAVVTTGIYCRPGCGARPLAQNTRTFELAAAAEAAGFRACHRCRPYRVAGPVGSNPPGIVCEAVQLIIGGVLDNGGTEVALAEQVGMSPRHLRRLFLTHLGATPDQFARSRRAHFARRLLDDTDLTILDIAFASGFGSLRQFNRTMREIFGDSPASLRGRRHQADRLAADGGLALRLPVTPDYDWAAVKSFLAARAIPGVEVLDGDTYRRTITVAGSPGLLEVSPGDTAGPAGGYLLLRAHLPYWEGLIHIVERVARVLGSDADHAADIAAVRADPVLGALAATLPDRLSPEHGIHSRLGYRGSCQAGPARAAAGEVRRAVGCAGARSADRPDQHVPRRHDRDAGGPCPVDLPDADAAAIALLAELSQRTEQHGWTPASGCPDWPPPPT